MRVRELIETLNQCPPEDLVVSCNNDDEIITCIESVRFGDTTPNGVTILEDYPERLK